MRSGRVGNVVKDGGSVQNGLGPPTIRLPVSDPKQQPGGVERQSQVHAVAHVDQPSGAVLELLAPRPRGESVLLARERQDEIREGLMNTEGVWVDVRARPANAPASKPVTTCPKKRKEEPR
jgi:hypothetical protein